MEAVDCSAGTCRVVLACTHLGVAEIVIDKIIAGTSQGVQALIDEANQAKSNSDALNGKKQTIESSVSGLINAAISQGVLK